MTDPTTAAARLRDSVNNTPDHLDLYYDQDGHPTGHAINHGWTWHDPADTPDGLRLQGRLGSPTPPMDQGEAEDWITAYRAHPTDTRRRLHTFSTIALLRHEADHPRP